MWPELRSKVYIKLSELISFMDSRCLIEQSLGHAQTTRRLDAVASHENFRYLPLTDINLSQAMENELYLYFKKSFRLFVFICYYQIQLTFTTQNSFLYCIVGGIKLILNFSRCFEGKRPQSHVLA